MLVMSEATLVKSQHMTGKNELSRKDPTDMLKGMGKAQDLRTTGSPGMLGGRNNPPQGRMGQRRTVSPDNLQLSNAPTEQLYLEICMCRHVDICMQ